MPRDVSVSEVGNAYELSRDQWQGNVARISKDSRLLKEVRKYTWTYDGGSHPYLRCKTLNTSLHKFVLGFIYGDEIIDKMLAEGNVIEHLDNNGLNCTYENLHILSEDMNKTKAFSIDKRGKDTENDPFPSYVLDVYYIHEKKQFQLQVFMNDDICCSRDGLSIAMLICMYNSFDDLFVDWFYLLSERKKRTFDKSKLHATEYVEEKCPSPGSFTSEEMDRPFIIRDGKLFINLSAKKDGFPSSIVTHTELRKIKIEDEE